MTQPSEASTAAIVELANGFIHFLNQCDPDWTTGYFRFSFEPQMSESKGSYQTPQGVTVIDVLMNRSALRALGDAAANIVKALEKERALLLLTVTSGFEYNIDFEYADMSRWAISKLDGQTGIPSGL